MRAALPTTLVTLLLLTFSLGCTKSASQVLASASNNLIITGVAVDANAAPVANATITAEQDPTVLATSDATGKFTMSLTRPQIAAIGNGMDHQRLSFVLYLRQKSQNLYSATTAISLSDIGLKNLGSITMAAPGGYSGKVMLAHAGQIRGAAGSSQVYIGPVKATVSSDGSFSAPSVPTGMLPLTVSAPAMHAFYDQVEIASGPVQNRADPIILFSGTGPDGLVIEKPTQSLLDLVKTGHQTSKHFAVHPADQTAFVRFSADLSKLEALGAQERALAAGKTPAGAFLAAQPTAQNSTLTPGTTGNAVPNTTTATTTSPGVSQTDIPWYPVGQDFDFDFPQSGGQTLYYQFTGATKTQFSGIYQVGVNIDPFADSSGFIIGDGSGQSPTSRVKLSVDVPAAAVSMRFASDDVSIANALWRPVSAEASFDFLPSPTDPGTGSTALARELFCQFQDAYGRTSGLYHATTTLNLFPKLGLRLGDGSGFLNSQVVPVNLDLPIGATKMRIAENLDLIKLGLWQTAVPQTQFLFVPQFDTVNSFYYVAGNREVCVQVEDDNAFISQAYCQKVMIDLFAGPSAGFQINGGATATTSRIVNLQINVPSNALEMRIFENAPENGVNNNGTISVITVGGAISTVAERTWLAANSAATYTFASSGSKALFVQFRTKGGLVSAAYEQNITVIPFIESFGRTFFTIAGGPIVIDPILQIGIFNVPESAIAVGVTVASNLRDDLITINAASNNLNLGGAVTTIWQDIRQPLFLKLRTSGSKIIQLQFRNADNDYSPVFQQVVTFDPFPADLVSLTLGNATVVANGNQNVASVEVAVTAPNSPLAKLMRFSAVPKGNAPVFGDYILPYAYNSVYSFPVAGTGSVDYTIWTQLKDIDGNESSAYSQNVTLSIPATTTTGNGSGTTGNGSGTTGNGSGTSGNGAGT